MPSCGNECNELTLDWVLRFVNEPKIDTKLLTDAGDGRNRSELMNNVSWQKVNVVVVQIDAGIFDALATQLIQFGVLEPLHALRYGRLVQVQLQFFDQKRKIASVKGDHIFGDPILSILLAALHCFQNSC